MLTTVIAVVSIHTGIALDASSCFSAVAYPHTTSTSTVLSFGIFLFAFSGHYVFPTIQHDMKNPRDFTKSVLAGFLGVILLYLPLCVFAFVVYGDSMAESVIYSIQSPFLQLLANLMIAFHCIMTLVIVINPLNQEVEHYAKISHAFGAGRIITRTIVLLLVLFVALTVPDFQPVMNLVGELEHFDSQSRSLSSRCFYDPNGLCRTPITLLLVQWSRNWRGMEKRKDSDFERVSLKSEGFESFLVLAEFWNEPTKPCWSSIL